MTEMAAALAAINERLLKTEGEIAALRQIIALQAIALDTVGSLDKAIFNMAVSSTRENIPGHAEDAATERFFDSMRATLDHLEIDQRSRASFLSVIDGGKK